MKKSKLFKHCRISIALLLFSSFFVQCSAQREIESLTKEQKALIEQEQLVGQIHQNELNLYENTQKFIVGDTIRKQARIINGELVFKSEIPWQVALIVYGSLPIEGQFCGGSIINEKWILTAAHCLERRHPTDIQVYSGSVNLNSEGHISNVKNIIIHPDYNNRTLDNDVALIELSTPITLTEEQNIISIPTSDLAYELLKNGTVATVSGWGITETGESSSSLKKVDIEIISVKKCVKSYGKSITNNMVCAGFDKGEKDACKGDSGGPLTIRDQNNNPVLVGVVSWGEGCAQPKLYGVYTKVHNYINWISSVTNATQTQEPI